MLRYTGGELQRDIRCPGPSDDGEFEALLSGTYSPGNHARRVPSSDRLIRNPSTHVVSLATALFVLGGGGTPAADRTIEPPSDSLTEKGDGNRWMGRWR